MQPQRETKAQELSRLLSSCQVKLLTSLDHLAKGKVDAFRESETRRLAELAKLEALIPNVKRTLEEAKVRRKRATYLDLIHETARRSAIQNLGVKERAVAQVRQVLRSSLGVPKPMSLPCSVSEINTWLRNINQPFLAMFFPSAEEKRFIEDSITAEEAPLVRSMKELGPHLTFLDNLRFDISFTNLESDLVTRFSMRSVRPKTPAIQKGEANTFLENVTFHSLLEEKGRMTHEEITRRLKVEFWPKKSEEKFSSLLSVHKRLSVNLQTSESDFFNQLTESFKAQIEDNMAALGDAAFSLKRLFIALKELMEVLKSADGGVCRKCRQYAIPQEGLRGFAYPTFIEKKKFVHQKCLDKFTNKLLG